MKFKEWLEKSGMSISSLSRACSINRGTIKNLVDGKRVSIKTLKRLIRTTKTMNPPVTIDLFEKIKGKLKHVRK